MGAKVEILVHPAPTYSFCAGCSSRGTPGDPSQLHRVSLRWRGEESGFRPGAGA